MSMDRQGNTAHAIWVNAKIMYQLKLTTEYSQCVCVVNRCYFEM